ncbi:MAG: PAS domain S-box protein [FCB group bacterium]|nr:PAS domain S-box protein [FCB group bacterium]
MAKNKKDSNPSEDEILNLIEAFKYFDKTTTSLNQAYRKLETKIDDLRLELEDKNRQLTGSMVEANRAKTFLTLILENMSSGVVVVDPSGVITVFNKVAGEITGYEPDSAVGRPYIDLLYDSEKPELNLINTLKSEKPIYRKEKNITTKAGEIKPIVFSSSVVLDEKEDLLGAVEIFEDQLKSNYCRKKSAATKPWLNWGKWPPVSLMKSGIP